jgi:hypothetical protein
MSFDFSQFEFILATAKVQWYHSIQARHTTYAESKGDIPIPAFYLVPHLSIPCVHFKCIGECVS